MKKGGEHPPNLIVKVPPTKRPQWCGSPPAQVFFKQLGAKSSLEWEIMYSIEMGRAQQRALDTAE